MARVVTVSADARRISIQAYDLTRENFKLSKSERCRNAA